MVKEQEEQQMEVPIALPEIHPLEIDLVKHPPKCFRILHEVLKHVPTKKMKQLRHVNSFWSRHVLTALRIRGEVLYRVNLSEVKYVRGSQWLTSFPEEEVLLDLESIEGVPAGVLVPFALSCDPLFWSTDNKQGLARFLEYGSEGLTEMNIRLDMNHFNFGYLTPTDNVRFKCLSKILMCFEGGELVEEGDLLTSGMNQFFRACPELKKLTFSDWGMEGPKFPPGIYATFPASLTELLLGWEVDATDLAVLTNSNLPWLKRLMILEINLGLGLGNQLFNNLLASFSKSLEYFVVGMAHTHVLSPQASVIVFPRMEKLHTFHFPPNVRIGYDARATRMEELVPKLRTLSFSQSAEYFQEFCVRCWSSVEYLSVDLMAESNIAKRQFDNVDYLPLGFAQVQGIARAFLGLTSFYLNLYHEAHLSMLPLVFANLRQLRKFSVQINIQVTTDALTGALLGVPVEAVVAFGILCRQGLAGYLDSFPNHAPGSIVHMQDLKIITIYTDGDGYTRIGDDGFTVSEEVFHFALFKMAQLRTLNFPASFTVSEEVLARWRETGRKIYWAPEVSDNEELDVDWVLW